MRSVRHHRWRLSLVVATAVVLGGCGSDPTTDEADPARGVDTTTVTAVGIPATAPATATTAPTPTVVIEPVTPRATSPVASVPAAAPAPGPPKSTPPATTAGARAPATSSATGTEGRPYDVFVPSGYDAATPAPLLVLLHGYTSSGAEQEQYFGLEPLAEERGILLVHPDGTTDTRGEQFWNATDACCNLFSGAIDDVAYLRALIDEVRAEYSVDPARIFFVGHSNGGFMSYRMACEMADTIAGIVSLAGATFADRSACTPSEPVTVVQIHGTADEVIAYDGGAIFGRVYPSAETTGQTWAAYNGCSETPEIRPDRLDLDRTIEGAESTISAYTGCPDDGAVEVWSIEGGAHGPEITDTVFSTALDLLLAHPKQPV